jgi:hypothetical protein
MCGTNTEIVLCVYMRGIEEARVVGKFDLIFFSFED